MRENKPDRTAPARPRHAKRRERDLPAALCSLLGTLMLLAVILACLPVPLSRMAGYAVYNVVSGSMEPAIPVGSAVWARPVNPADLQPGEIIAFYRGDTVVVHRVTENDTVQGALTTKGDANNGVDVNEVRYSQVIGRVTRHLPVLGALLGIYTGGTGRIYAVCFAACGALLNLVGARLRAHKRENSG